MKDPRNEPSQEVKDRLNAEGFVHSDSRPEQTGSGRVTPESESLINRVNDRVSQLMKKTNGLTAEAAKEQAMGEIETEIETGRRLYPDMDSYVMAMGPKMKEGEMLLGNFSPPDAVILEKVLIRPGDFVEFDGGNALMGGTKGVIFMSKDSRLRYLPFPLPGVIQIGQLKNPDYRDHLGALGKLGFTNKSPLGDLELLKKVEHIFRKTFAEDEAAKKRNDSHRRGEEFGY